MKELAERVFSKKMFDRLSSSFCPLEKSANESGVLLSVTMY
jgi:hypothetical protein